MNTKHTPGPWSYYPDENRIVAFTEYTIANLERSMKPESDEANSKLIAAAPELLEALHHILRAHDSGNNGAFMGEAVLCGHFAEKARAAIAKATE
jgi:hypothetical protein